MNYKALMANFIVNLTVMARDAAVELEREGYVKVVTSNKGRKVYFKPTEIHLEPLINAYADAIMKATAKNYKFDNNYKFDESNREEVEKNYKEAKELVSKYVTVDTFKKDIKELQGRIED